MWHDVSAPDFSNIRPRCCLPSSAVTPLYPARTPFLYCPSSSPSSAVPDSSLSIYDSSVTMPFKPPSYVPKLPFEIPDSVSIEQFLLTDRPGQAPLSKSKDPFTCGLTGKTYSALDVKARVDALARGLGKELGFKVNEGSEYDKVVGVYTLNSVSSLSFRTARSFALREHL